MNARQNLWYAVKNKRGSQHCKHFMLDATLEAHLASIDIVNATVNDKADAGKAVKQKIRFLVVDIDEIC
jgi:hypothetical protein